uniref:Putative secreted protein n=1 Tax=Ixodes ricinus TaxID=34613 RepID=A0A6B0ULD7_IXORI
MKSGKPIISVMASAFSLASSLVSRSIHLSMGRLFLKASLTSWIMFWARGLLSPSKTSLTNMAPSAKPMTALVSVTQYRQAVSEPSEPMRAFRSTLDASRNGSDRYDTIEWTMLQAR